MMAGECLRRTGFRPAAGSAGRLGRRPRCGETATGVGAGFRRSARGGFPPTERAVSTRAYDPARRSGGLSPPVGGWNFPRNTVSGPSSATSGARARDPGRRLEAALLAFGRAPASRASEERHGRHRRARPSRHLRSFAPPIRRRQRACEQPLSRFTASVQHHWASGGHAAGAGAGNCRLESRWSAGPTPKRWRSPLWLESEWRPAHLKSKDFFPAVFSRHAEPNQRPPREHHGPRRGARAPGLE